MEAEQLELSIGLWCRVPWHMAINRKFCHLHFSVTVGGVWKILKKCNALPSNRKWNFFSPRGYSALSTNKLFLCDWIYASGFWSIVLVLWPQDAAHCYWVEILLLVKSQIFPRPCIRLDRRKSLADKEVECPFVESVTSRHQSSTSRSLRWISRSAEKHFPLHACMTGRDWFGFHGESMN